MYLSKLTGIQKELVLDLCINASNANGIFSSEEQNYINQYAEEMNIPVRFESSNSNDEAVKKLVEVSSPSELRGIGVELIALLLSDNSYDDDEKEYMIRIGESFGISEIILDDIAEKISELFDIYSRLNSIVFD